MTLNDIFLALNAFIGDASTGGATEQARKLFCINMAKDYLISQVGLPASEVTESISFIDSNNLYPVTDGMLEPISLRYDPSQGQDSNNIRQNNQRGFEYMHTDELYEYQHQQANDIVYWGMDYGNNNNQLVVITNNIVPSQIINDLTQQTGIYALGDASQLGNDTNVWKVTGSSTTFTVNYSTGKAYIQVQLPSETDFTPFLNTGVFSLDLFIQSIIGLSTIDITFGSDTISSVSPSPNFSNYYTISATTQADGTSFEVDNWNNLSWNYSDATIVGSPNIAAITYYQIELDITNAMPHTTLWRMNNLKVQSPDNMLFTYYSGNVVNGGTQTDFVLNSDIADFGDIDPSIIRIVAGYAAMLYKPTSLLMDANVIQKWIDRGIENLSYRFPKKTLPFLQRLKVVRR